MNSLPAPEGTASLASSFGAEYGNITGRSRRRVKWGLILCIAAAITLLTSVAALKILQRGERRKAGQGRPSYNPPRKVERGDSREEGARPLSERFPQAAGDYSLVSVKQSVAEDLRRDSLEALAASYAAGGGRQVTYVLVSYPTAERAKESLEAKVTAMREGSISRAEVVERGPKKDASGRAVGDRVVLSMAVLEQIIWTEGVVLGLVTSRVGQALEFEHLLSQR